MIAGVYQIRNRITGEVYVGTSINVFLRVRGHFSGLKTGWHHNRRLQKDWKAFGPSAFSVCLLESMPADADLITAERQWIATLRSRATGLYNAMEPRNSPRETRQRRRQASREDAPR